MVAHEAPARNPEKQIRKPEIPKSREIFTGDINDAVIAVQQITGFEITTDWWLTEVGNDGTTEDILDKFDDAFEKFVHAQMGIESPESEQAAIVAEAEYEVSRFDDEVVQDPGLEPLREEFLDALKAHLKEKYYGSTEIESKSEFELTDPQERLYGHGELYRFLVHVPLGDVDTRASEIGQERGSSKLMLSLISEEHQGTFMGEVGIIVAEPRDGSISGIASIDVGGEIQADRQDEVEDIIAPAPPYEYNQIDLAFDGTEPIGVLIKQTPDGQHLGSPERNKSLITYAKKHNLPVVTVEVQPAELITEAAVDIFELSEGQGEVLTIDLPFSDTEFIRSQVLRIGEQNVVYQAGDEDRVARTMRVNQYGESTQKLTKEEVDLIVDRLKKLKLDNPEQISDEDISVIAIECLRLLQSN